MFSTVIVTFSYPSVGNWDINLPHTKNCQSFFFFCLPTYSGNIRNFRMNTEPFCLPSSNNTLELTNADRRILTALHTFWNATKFLHLLLLLPLCIWPKAQSWFLMSFSSSHLRLDYQTVSSPVPHCTLSTVTVIMISVCLTTQRWEKTQ